MLELHGWGDLQDDLNRMSKEGKWKEMGELIDDDILDAFAVVAEPEKHRRRARTSATATSSQRLSFYAPYASDPERWAAVMDASSRRRDAGRGRLTTGWSSAPR